jgi:YVTN family beta-propeller protein
MRGRLAFWTAIILAWSLLAAGTAFAQSETDEPGEAEERDPHRRRSTLYIAARDSHEVIALSRDTFEIIARIPVGKRPMGLAARPDGDRVYVACAGSHTIEVIDGATRKVLDKTSLTHGAAPTDVVLRPARNTLFVAASGLDQVIRIDAPSLQQTGEASVGRDPQRLALSRDGRRLFVMSVQSGRVDILDTATMARISSVPVGSRPGDLALDPATGSVFVVRPGNPVISRIDAGSAQAREIFIDAPAESVAVDRRAGRLVLSSPDSARISIVSPGTGAAVKVISAEEVTRIVVDPEGARLYALSARRNVLLIVDRILGEVERKVPVEEGPWDLELIP